MLNYGRKIIVLAILAGLGAGIYAWCQWDELSGWYYFQQLRKAEGAERERLVKKLVALDAAILPQAIDCLRSSLTGYCTDGEEVLIGLTRNWKDVRAANILKELLDKWPSFSDPGKNSVLTVARVVIEEKGENSPVGFLGNLADDLLRLGAEDPQTQRTSLQLAIALARLVVSQSKDQIVRWEDTPKELLLSMVDKGLTCPDFDVRILALRLVLAGTLNKDADTLAKVASYLRDVSAEARRLALLIVGSNQDLLSDDDLLPLLRDEDAEVCRLCEVALRSRGLQDEHIVLARLITDERPAARLEVPQYLEQVRDLDPGVWLKRLCQDPSPAVRAAAIRAAASQDVADLRDQIRSLARDDASETVRQLAVHYLHVAPRPR